MVELRIDPKKRMLEMRGHTETNTKMLEMIGHTETNTNMLEM